ncbi:hypothetical protein ACF0H5_000942 [Mactra antiquata]
MKTMTEKKTEQKSEVETSEVSPDDIIEELGGCGPFQIRLSLIVHLIKTVVCFSVNTLVLFSATPNWFCANDELIGNISSCFDNLDGNNESERLCADAEKQCNVNKSTKCSTYEYDDYSISTFTGEFNLVCGNDFIPSTISSINIVGLLLGNLAGGQLADLYGRKPTFYASIVLLMLFHLLAYFAQSWQVFAVAMFFTGVGNGFFLTVQYAILSEYSLSRCRVWMVGFPSWPLQTSLLALCAYLLHDWRNVELLIAMMAIPALMTWFVVPESFRWHVGHNDIKKAQKIVIKVAECNKREHVKVNIEKLRDQSKQDDGGYKKYTFLQLFKTWEMAKVTLLLMLDWGSLDIISYGIYFGIQTLSGNMYMNIFLFSIVGIPSKFLAIYLQNRFGRRTTTLLCYAITAVTSLTVGVVQTIEPVNKDSLANGFAMVASASISATWGPLQTMTLEMYPTVIRNIGFGSLSVVGKISAVIGPQLVYLNSYVSGLLYYVCGALSLLSAVGTLFLPETKGLKLQDKIEQSNKDDNNTSTENIPKLANVESEMNVQTKF